MNQALHQRPEIKLEMEQNRYMFYQSTDIAGPRWFGVVCVGLWKVKGNESVLAIVQSKRANGWGDGSLR